MRSRMQGLTLVEMMVAMLLGLVVIGGAISLTLANRQSYRTNEGLSQVQESARTAFELLARDIRQAGVSGCENNGQIANVLDTSGGVDWWMPWFGIRGYQGDEDNSVDFGTTRGERVADTDAIQLQGIQGAPWTLVSHNAGAATMEVNTTPGDPGFVAGDIMLVCDFDHTTIFQATAWNAASDTLSHDIGVVTPGNCSRGLGFPTDCASAAGNVWPFPKNSLLSRFFATDWYIGDNGRDADGGRSLFRRRLAPGGGLITEEVVAGVSDMQLQFRRDGSNDFEDGDTFSAANWDDVNAVQVTLTVLSTDARVATDTDDGGRIRRDLSQIITLRNRVP